MLLYCLCTAQAANFLIEILCISSACRREGILLLSSMVPAICPCAHVCHFCTCFSFEHNTEERKISKRYDEPKTSRPSAKVFWCRGGRPISFPGRFLPHHLTQTWFPPKVVFMKKRSFLLLTLGSLAVRLQHMNIPVCHFQHIFLFCITWTHTTSNGWC